LETDKIPFGANFAIRAPEQKRFRYDPAAGAGSGNFRLGEETAVITQILLSGATGFWVPDAAVKHRIGLARQSLAYVEDYFIRLGRTVAHGRITGEDHSHRLYILLHFMAKLINGGLIAASKPWLPARIWLPLFMSQAFHKGAFEQFIEARSA